jgi:short-subunit dehydrogenase
MNSLAGKTVVITGAGSGIGRSLALECAKVSANLALCDINEGLLQETRALLEEHSVKLLVTVVNVSSWEEMQTFAKVVADYFGGIDVLINNAGVSLSETVAETRLEDFEWIMKINFWGVVYGCRAFLPHLTARPESHIINLSSSLGLVGMPTQSAYCASKFAVRGFTEALHQEYAQTNLRVTCIHPGNVKTNIVKFGRHYRNMFGDKPQEVNFEEDFSSRAMTRPEQAAQQIIHGILQNKMRVLVGPDAKMIDLCQRVLPQRYGKVILAINRFFRWLNPTQKIIT